jgi:hypothetical protein
MGKLKLHCTVSGYIAPPVTIHRSMRCPESDPKREHGFGYRPRVLVWEAEGKRIKVRGRLLSGTSLLPRPAPRSMQAMKPKTKTKNQATSWNETRPCSEFRQNMMFVHTHVIERNSKPITRRFTGKTVDTRHILYPRVPLDT